MAKCLKGDRLCCRRDGSARQPVAMLLRKRLDGGLAPQVSPFIKSGFKSSFTSSKVKANKFRKFILDLDLLQVKIFNSNKVFEIKVPPKIT
jgi:hypothetical protein